MDKIGEQIMGLATICGIVFALVNIALDAKVGWGGWFGLVVMLVVAVDAIWRRWIA